MTSRSTRYWSSGAIPLIAPDILGDVIAHAADISVVISDLGEVLSLLVNPDHASFGRLDGWVGRDIRTTLTSESVEKFERRLAELNAGKTGGRGIELNHAEAPDLCFPIRYSFHSIGPDGAILMLGRDLRPVAQMQQQLVEAQVALERDYENRREISTRMKVLMETTRDAVVFASLGTGRILDLNGRAARLLDANVEELRGRPLAAALSAPDGALDISRLAEGAGENGSGPIRVRVRGHDRGLALRTTSFRAGGERMLLCRLDRETEAGGEAGAEPAQMRAAQFFELSPDAIVFTDRAGHILSANEGFFDLVDCDGLASVKGKSLGDFFARGSVDLKVLSEGAIRNGEMKLYATRVLTPFGGERQVEVSAAALDDAAHPALGFALRDVGRVESLRSPPGTEGLRPARDLVGAATLKEIVSETTEVIEKMCIETAVELTGNNRMAAAEMLGLSRQSLYVKLRKYGLLVRDD